MSWVIRKKIAFSKQWYYLCFGLGKSSTAIMKGYRWFGNHGIDGKLKEFKTETEGWKFVELIEKQPGRSAVYEVVKKGS